MSTPPSKICIKIKINKLMSRYIPATFLKINNRVKFYLKWNLL